MTRLKLNENAQSIISAFFLSIFSMVGMLFLYLQGIPSLEGLNDFQFFADSATYHQIAQGGLFEYESIYELVSVSSNYLGPILILELLQQNYYAVLVLNVCILWFSVEAISRGFKASRRVLYMVLLINPVTISSLLAVNKEILSLLAIALLLLGIRREWRTFLILAVVCGMLVRWQFALFEVIVILTFSRFNIFSKRRSLMLLTMVGAASIFLLQFGDVIRSVQENFSLAAENYEGSGFYTQLVQAQSDGFYWLVLIPKTFHLLFGLGIRFDRLIAPVNVYNDVWQLLHSTMLLVIFILLLVKKRLQLRHDLIYISAIYLIIFVMTPIYVPRYFYPVYVLWAIVLAIPNKVRIAPGNPGEALTDRAASVAD